jgi:uncharacterized protein (DUF2147 family)
MGLVVGCECQLTRLDRHWRSQVFLHMLYQRCPCGVMAGIACRRGCVASGAVCRSAKLKDDGHN